MHDRREARIQQRRIWENTVKGRASSSLRLYLNVSTFSCPLICHPATPSCHPSVSISEQSEPGISSVTALVALQYFTCCSSREKLLLMMTQKCTHGCTNSLPIHIYTTISGRSLSLPAFSATCTLFLIINKSHFTVWKEETLAKCLAVVQDLGVHRLKYVNTLRKRNVMHQLCMAINASVNTVPGGKM